MAALSETQTTKVRLPRLYDNIYPSLGVPQATANFMDNVEPAYSYPEARARGKKLIKAAAYLAALGIGVWGATEFAQNVLQNTEQIPAQPAQIQK